MGYLSLYFKKYAAIMNKHLFPLVLILCLLDGCKQPESSIEAGLIGTSQNAISVSGTRFIDSYGRQVIFSGINKVNKNQRMNYTDSDPIGTFEQFNRWGFNCVRLGVIWDGVEPEPGKYDEKYLDKLEERVNWAAQNGMYVMLDMHQDLYGVDYSDGAPKWATLTENLPHFTGSVWSDSYLISPAVQKAFDNFWTNIPASDGIGIQDHYIRMWQHVAKRFANNKAIIGFDIMNEPFNGTQGKEIISKMIQGYSKLYAEETGKILSEKEGMAIWSDEKLRFEALSRLQTQEKYARVIDEATEMNQQFEKTILQQMYQNVGNAIREVDSTHILFLEHAYFMNTGVYSAIEPVKGKNGKPDPLVAYAGHGYDLLVDTKNYDSQSNSRVDLIFSRVNETSQRMNVPIIVGEWGAFGDNSDATTSSARFIVGLFERFGFSNTYWSYYTGIEKKSFFINALLRPYPQFIGGTLEKYSFNNENGVFNCTWKESPTVKASTVIYIPDLERLVRENITMIPGSNNIVIQSIKNSKAGYVIIPVSGLSRSRTLEFKLKSVNEAISIEDKTGN
jgi:endoglycosylceramidase